MMRFAGRTRDLQYTPIEWLPLRCLFIGLWIKPYMGWDRCKAIMFQRRCKGELYS